MIRVVEDNTNAYVYLGIYDYPLMLKIDKAMSAADRELTVNGVIDGKYGFFYPGMLRKKGLVRINEMGEAYIKVYVYVNARSLFNANKLKSFIENVLIEFGGIELLAEVNKCHLTLDPFKQMQLNMILSRIEHNQFNSIIKELNEFYRNEFRLIAKD